MDFGDEIRAASQASNAGERLTDLEILTAQRFLQRGEWPQGQLNVCQDSLGVDIVGY
jgi:hypothetical protein